MEPYIGEIRAFSFNRIPKGWAPCHGQTLLIMQNQALYSLIGTTYGGDGVTTFALPDLRGRVPVHPNTNGILLGTMAGEEQHTLTTAELPAHTHSIKVSSNPGNLSTPANNTWAVGTNGNKSYTTETTNLQPMNTNALDATGGSQPHNNMQPFTVVNYCIAVQGIYPTRN
nr:tail fiber protein [Lysinibacillus timonensis]